MSKNGWRRYRIGNWLRDHFIINARSTEEAWRRGCARFNRSFPSKSKEGRLIGMDAAETRSVRTTAWSLAEFKRPTAKRYFKEFGDPRVTEFWVPVAYGNSKQPLLRQ